MSRVLRAQSVCPMAAFEFAYQYRIWRGSGDPLHGLLERVVAVADLDRPVVPGAASDERDGRSVRVWKSSGYQRLPSLAGRCNGGASPTTCRVRPPAAARLAAVRASLT